MKLAPRSVAGFRGLRAEILIALKMAQPLTAKELAARFSVTPNALRRHLKELESAGLVGHSREVRGVGGPTYAYALREAGEELFPRAYVPALLDAIEAVHEVRGTEGVVDLFERHWAATARGAEPELARLPLDQRARRLAELLTLQGYMAESESRSPTEATIREHNCALRAVAERFPELCAAEARFFTEVLGAAVERQAHILGGCNACEYVVQVRPNTGATARAGTDAGRWNHIERTKEHA